MNQIILVIGIIIFSFSSCGFMNNNPFTKNETVNLDYAVTQETGNENVYFTSDFNIESVPEPDIFYAVLGTFGKPISISKIKKAKSIKDLIEYYPSNWIKDYLKVEIIVDSNGKEIKATSPDDILSTEQLQLLLAADYSTEIGINVFYKAENAVTKEMQVREMNTRLTLIPDVEASYVEGYDQLIIYLKEQSIAAIEAKNVNIMEALSILFSVNTQGKIKNARLKNSTGHDDVDKMLIELVTNMPTWNAAKNAEGKTVRQNFELIISKGGC